MSIGEWKNIADIFQSFAIGLGALAGGFGALKVLGDWATARKRRKNIRRWRKRFPKSKINEAFKLIYPKYENVIGGGPIYINDIRTGTKHWVADEETLRILGFNLDEATGLAKSQFDKIKDGAEISLAA